MAETTQQQVLFSAFRPPPSAFYYGRSNNEPPRFSAWQSGMAIGAKMPKASDSGYTDSRGQLSSRVDGTSRERCAV
ncbi:MAG: hypothetical protein ACFE0I_01095 [Elainellaceae cyanobacterium]